MIVAGAAAVRLPILYRTIGPAQLGVVAALSAVVPILLVPTAGVRAAARAVTSRSLGDPRARLPIPLGLVTLWSAVAAGCPLLALTRLFGDSATTTEVAVALGMAGGGSCIALLGAASWGHFESTGRFRVTNASIALCSALGLLLTLLLRDAAHPVPVHTAIAVFSASAPFALVACADLYGSRRSGSSVGVAAGFGGRLTGLESLRAVPPLATRVTDPLFLSALVSQSAVADYSIALRTMLLASLPFNASLPVWAAEGSRRTTELGRRSAVLRRALLINGLGSVLVGVLFAIVGPTFVEALTGSPTSRPLCLLLAGTIPLQAVTGTFTAVLVGRGTSGAMLRLESLGMALNVVLSFYFSISIGLVGPALASVLALSLLACLQVVFTRRRGTNGTFVKGGEAT